MTSGVKRELSVASASRWRWRWRALRPFSRRTRYRWGRGGHERREYWSAPPAPAAQRRGTQSWLLRLPASGSDARRGARSRSTQSLLHLREELLEQPEQLERRAAPGRRPTRPRAA